MKKLKSKTKIESAVKELSILDRIRPIQELDLILTCLLYGRSGTGKTTLASTFPKPILLLDIGEKGTDSIFDVNGVDSVQVNTWKELEDLYWFLKDGVHKYKSVIIDACHSMQDLALAAAQKQSNKEEGEQLSKRDFGIAAGLMKQWLYNYRDLQDMGINIVFLAHDRLTKEEGDSEDGALAPEVGPRLMPSVASPLAGAVKIVGHTFVREVVTKAKKAGEKSKRVVEYCLRVGPHSYYTTKVRSPKAVVTPDFIIDPSFDKLVRVMRGTGANQNTPTSTSPAKRVLKRKVG